MDAAPYVLQRNPIQPIFVFYYLMNFRFSFIIVSCRKEKNDVAVEETFVDTV